MNLASNEIGADGAEALVKSLEKNSTLTDLNLTANNIGLDAEKALICVLAKDPFFRTETAFVAEKLRLKIKCSAILQTGLNFEEFRSIQYIQFLLYESFCIYIEGACILV